MKGAQNRRSLPNVEPEVLVDADLDTLATALYVRTDDLLKDNPHRIPWRPKVGITPLISTLNWLIGALARDTSVWADDVWGVDSTPVECSRSRETVKRSDLAGWAEYGLSLMHISEPTRLGMISYAVFCLKK